MTEQEDVQSGTMTRISLVIPAKDEEKTIGQVIEEAIEWAGENIDEIIVVDDGSDDRTGTIAKEKGAKVIRNEKSLGADKAVQEGIENSSNDIIMTIDADMEHDPRDIRRFISLFEENKPDIIVGKRKILPRKGERVLSKFFEEFYGIKDVLCGMRLIDKKVFKDCINFSSGDMHGMGFYIDAGKKGKKILNCPLTEMRRREGARIGDDETVDRKCMEWLVKVLKKHLEEPQ